MHPDRSQSRMPSIPTEDHKRERKEPMLTSELARYVFLCVFAVMAPPIRVPTTLFPLDGRWHRITVAAVVGYDSDVHLERMPGRCWVFPGIVTRGEDEPWAVSGSAEIEVVAGVVFEVLGSEKLVAG